MKKLCLALLLCSGSLFAMDGFNKFKAREVPFSNKDAATATLALLVDQLGGKKVAKEVQDRVAAKLPQNKLAQEAGKRSVQAGARASEVLLAQAVVNGLSGGGADRYTVDKSLRMFGCAFGASLVANGLLDGANVLAEKTPFVKDIMPSEEVKEEYVRPALEVAALIALQNVCSFFRSK